MVTVLIECDADAAGLGIALASLVPGAVEGLVREVVVIDRGMDAAATKVADHAGCQVVAASGLRAAIAGAKGHWLLFMEPGARLGTGWIEAVAEYLADVEAGNGAGPRAARFTPVRAGALPFFDRLRLRRPALEAGLLLPKAEGLQLAAKHDTLEAMGRRLATQRLAATIRPRSLKG